MIIGERILEISGNKHSQENIQGLSINIALDDVMLKDGILEIVYTYTASYEDKVGMLSLKGMIMAKEEEKLAHEVSNMWKKNKKMPEAYAETVLSAINYSGSANGTLVARVLGLTAPLIPPRIQLSNKS